MVGASGNSFGSRLWTDGYLFAPMLQPYARAILCPHCDEAFFREDAREVDRYSPDGEAGQWDRFIVKHDGPPLVSDGGLPAYRALLDKTRDRERLRYLRTRIWHVQNDRIREEHEKALEELHDRSGSLLSRLRPAREPEGSREEPTVLDEGYAENLRALVDLLGDAPEESLMKAEIHRELGMFDRAVEIARTVSGELEWVARQIIALAEAGDARVAVLRRPGDDDD